MVRAREPNATQRDATQRNATQRNTTRLRERMNLANERAGVNAIGNMDGW
jgi:hypothetical protein